MEEKTLYTVTVFSENRVGLLNQISIIFNRRRLNIETLSVSPSALEGIHKFTITTYTDLEKHLRSQGITSNREIKRLFDNAKEAGILVKNEKKKYRYNGFRPIPNDKTEDIPFAKPEGEENPPF